MPDKHLPSRLNLDVTADMRRTELQLDQLASILKAVIHNGVPNDRHDGSGIRGVMVPLQRGGFLHEIANMYDLEFMMDIDNDTLYVNLIPTPVSPTPPPAKQEGRFTDVQDVTAIRPIRGVTPDSKASLRESDRYRTHLESLDEGGRT